MQSFFYQPQDVVSSQVQYVTILKVLLSGKFTQSLVSRVLLRFHYVDMLGCLIIKTFALGKSQGFRSYLPGEKVSQSLFETDSNWTVSQWVYEVCNHREDRVRCVDPVPSFPLITLRAFSFKAYKGSNMSRTLSSVRVCSRPQPWNSF